MRDFKSNRFVYITAFFLATAGIIGLLVFNLKNSKMYFFTVKEVCTEGLNTNSKIRIFGKVEGIKNSLNSVTFKLVDIDSPKNWIWVKYKGLLPDTFRSDADVIVEGSFKNHRIFLAQKLMTKCPSKYKSK